MEISQHIVNIIEKAGFAAAAAAVLLSGAAWLLPRLVKLLREGIEHRRAREDEQRKLLIHYAESLAAIAERCCRSIEQGNRLAERNNDLVKENTGAYLLLCERLDSFSTELSRLSGEIGRQEEEARGLRGDIIRVSERIKCGRGG